MKAEEQGYFTLVRDNFHMYITDSIVCKTSFGIISVFFFLLIIYKQHIENKRHTHSEIFTSLLCLVHNHVVLILSFFPHPYPYTEYLQDEWRRGLKALRADTVSKLKKALPDLEKEV